MRPQNLLAPAAALLLLTLAGCPSPEPRCGDGTPEGEATCAALCGNGTIDPGEECDDGNAVDGDGCQSTCTLGVVQKCGNGVKEGSEACDDGNEVDGDGCESNCSLTVPVCGNGVKEGDEACDDGNRTGGDGCENDCTPTPGAACGNAVVEAGEACDDGNQVPFDGCENDCTVSTVQFEQCPGAMLPAPSGGPCDIVTGDAARLLTGDVLVPGKVYVGGQVLFDAQGIIQCVGCDCTQEPGAAAATQVVCPGSVVSPGLVNPHDHITFYAAPYVNTSGERYEHRHDWRRGNNGHNSISSGPNTDTNAIQWNELRQILVGTTSVAGSGGVRGLLRNLDRNTTSGAYPEGLSVSVSPIAQYDTFPLDDIGGLELTNSCNYDSLKSAPYPGPPASGGAWLPHISEGIEASARNEFLCLSGVGTGSVNAVDSKTAVIHGIGMRAADVARLAALETSLIWSPRSNIYLYGDTAPIGTYKRLGVNIALGTDWVRSGSMNLLRELRCADSLNRTQFGNVLRDEELWLMVTANAARALRFDAQIGTLAKGKVADIAIFTGTAASPYRVIIEARPQDVVLTIRGGKVLFGEQTLVTALTADACEPLDVCGSQKSVCVSSELNKTLATLQGQNASTYALFFCGEPENEPTCTPSRSMPWAVNGSSIYTGVPAMGDRDGDGIPDGQDNCPDLFNPIRPMDNGAQADGDADGIGDVCDVCPLDPHTTACTQVQPGDSDGDGVPDHLDNCPTEPNPDQADTDMDGIGDACDWCPVHNAGNSACPTTIYEVKKGTHTDRPVLLGGVQVTAVKAATGFYLQVPTTSGVYTGPDHSGLFVYSPAQASMVQVGDIISLEGLAKDFFGQIQLNNVAGITVTSSGNPAFTPVAVTPAEVASGGTRSVALESVIVRVENVTVTQLEPAPAGGETAPTWEFVVDGALRVNDFLYRTSPFPVVGEQLSSITGVLNYRNANFKLEPRDASDIVGGPATVVGFGPAGAFTRVGHSGPTFPSALTVTISRPQASATDVTVTSSSLDLVVDNNGVVTIPAGATSAPVPVTGVAQNAQVTLTASLNASMATTTVRVLGLLEPAALDALTAPGNAIPPGSTLTLTVHLDIPAPTDTVVSLDLNPSAFGSIPADVTVLQNQQTATVTLTADPAATGMATVTATLGSDTRSLTVTSAAVCMPTQVVISQVYGGGGNSGAPLTHDFIELHNRSAQPVAIGGWSVQYASATGTSWGNKTDIPAGTTLPPGGYFLIQQAGGTNGVALPTPDLTGGIAMSATSGKVALVSSTTALTGATPTSSTIVDLLGYGSTATAFETEPTASLSATTAAVRKGDGCTDTQNNKLDFTVTAPVPRNSASAAVSCGCN
jgi:cysteine-rich repeat protein